MEDIAYCKVCSKVMRTIVREVLGESYWCEKCGALIDVSHDNGQITFDRLDPLQTTRENGEDQ